MTSNPEPSFLVTTTGKLTLALLCAIAFLDFVDASIVNVALPDIRRELGFSVSALQWVPAAYLLTYGGFMLLGGRAADLLGRRPVLVAGILTIGVSSLIGGLAQSEGVLIGARLAQGLGAAMTLPAALSILTTSYREGRDRNTALGAWGAMGGLASAAGVLLGGLLTEGPGWRWVMWVNPIACVLVLAGIYRLLDGDRRRERVRDVDARGAVLVTGGMLLLVYTLVEAPSVGWGALRTIAGLAGALVILAAFVVNEQRASRPLAPLSIFRINGLGYADATQMVAVSGFISMFFILTLYMQGVLGYTPIQTGLSYLPLCAGFVVSAGVASQLLTRLGTRPLIVAGALISSGAMYWLSRIPVDGSFAADILPGTLLISLGFGPVFVAVTTAANAGVPADRAGLAASLLNASTQLGGALGLAILTAIAAGRTNGLLASGSPMPDALTGGFRQALLVGAILIFASAFVGLRATNTQGESGAEPGPGRDRDDGERVAPVPEPAGV